MPATAALAGRVRIFVYEFVTGGGMAGGPLPGPGARGGPDGAQPARRTSPDSRGRAARPAGIRGCPRSPACQVIVPVRTRSQAPLYERGLAAAAMPPGPPRPRPAALWSGCRATLRAADSCSAAARRPSASRPASADSRRPAAAGHSRRADLREPVRTFRPWPGRWVIKPDDGAGCGGHECRRRLAGSARPRWHRRRRLVAQPWVDGDAAEPLPALRGGAARAALGQSPADAGHRWSAVA